MKINVNRICDNKNFFITGVSYIGEPISNTVMYVSKKVEHLIEKLKDEKECLIFAEDNIEVPSELDGKHAFVFSKNPQLSYVNFVSEIDREQQLRDRKISYRYEDGYHISESAVVGNNVYIEPGCVIGHHVVIGDGVEIRAGSIIKNAIIGNNCLINEGALIGDNGFATAKDENGNLIRIPCFGKAVIGNNVEIGPGNHIARGFARDTVIDDYVKLDALIHVGHDVQIGKNSELTAGTIVAGYTVFGPKCYTGPNSTIMNRIVLGENSFVGIGTLALKDVEPGAVMAGVPARRLR